MATNWFTDTRSPANKRPMTKAEWEANSLAIDVDAAVMATLIAWEVPETDDNVRAARRFVMKATGLGDAIAARQAAKAGPVVLAATERQG